MFLQDLRSSAEVEPQLVSPPELLLKLMIDGVFTGPVLHTITKRALREQTKQIVFCKQ